MLFTHFYLSEKKTETWTVSPISRYTAKYVFSQVQLQNQLFQSVGIQLQCPCTNPLNCLRNIGTIVITQKLTKTASNSFSLSNSPQKLSFFVVLMYSLYGLPDISSSSANINKYDLQFQIITLFLMTMVPGIQMITFIFIVSLAKSSKCRRNYLLKKFK